MKQFKWLQRLSFELLCSTSDYFFSMEIWSKMFVNTNNVFRTVGMLFNEKAQKSAEKVQKIRIRRALRDVAVYVLFILYVLPPARTPFTCQIIFYSIYVWEKNPVNELVYNQSGLVNSLVLMPFACYRIHQVSATSSQWASAQLMQFIQFTVECTQITESTP